MSRLGEKLILFLNQYFPPSPNSGGREDIDSYHEVQYRAAHEQYKFFSKFVDFEDKTILDLGCGLGGKTVYCAIEKRPRSIIGVDIDEFSLQNSTKLREKHKLRNVQFKKIKKSTLPFEDDYFDIVVSFTVLEHVSDLQALLKECKRVIKPEGFFCFYFGYLYYCNLGHHLYDYIYIPWFHLLFSQDSICRATVKLPEKGHIFNHKNAINTFKTLNKLTFASYTKIFRSLDMKILQYYYRPCNFKTRIPVVRNLFIENANLIMQK